MVQFNARRPDLTGRVFGRLTVEGFAGKDRHHNRLWHCRCACGNSTVVRSRCLLMGTTRGCGCLQREFIRQRNTTHGKSDLPEYQAWADLIQRCTNPRVAWCEIGSVTTAPIEQMLLIRTKAIQNRIERTRAMA